MNGPLPFLFFYFAIVFHLVTTLSIPPSLSLCLHHFLISPFLIPILVLTFLALLFILLPPLHVPRLLPLLSLLPPLHCTSYFFNSYSSPNSSSNPKSTHPLTSIRSFSQRIEPQVIPIHICLAPPTHKASISPLHPDPARKRPSRHGRFASDKPLIS